jgi:hypothetical protein
MLESLRLRSRAIELFLKEAGAVSKVILTLRTYSVRLPRSCFDFTG